MNPYLWEAVGWIGQVTFGSRFFVQWVASEKAGKSVVPPIFWWLSLLGAMLVLSYAIHIHKPVFILPQISGILIYARNLWIIRKAKHAAA